MVRALHCRSVLVLRRYNGCDAWTHEAGIRDSVISMDTGLAAPGELAAHVEATLLHHQIEGTAL